MIFGSKSKNAIQQKTRVALVNRLLLMEPMYPTQDLSQTHSVRFSRKWVPVWWTAHCPTLHGKCSIIAAISKASIKQIQFSSLKKWLCNKRWQVYIYKGCEALSKSLQVASKIFNCFVLTGEKWFSGAGTGIFSFFFYDYFFSIIT